MLDEVVIAALETTELTNFTIFPRKQCAFVFSSNMLPNLRCPLIRQVLTKITHCIGFTLVLAVSPFFLIISNEKTRVDLIK
jgi:F0F1-type ATP synthase membrane subunit a